MLSNNMLQRTSSHVNIRSLPGITKPPDMEKCVHPANANACEWDDKEALSLTDA